MFLSVLIEGYFSPCPAREFRLHDVRPEVRVEQRPQLGPDVPRRVAAAVQHPRSSAAAHRGDLALPTVPNIVGVHCLQDGPHHLCSVMNCINTDNVTIDNGIISVHHLSA